MASSVDQLASTRSFDDLASTQSSASTPSASQDDGLGSSQRSVSHRVSKSRRPRKQLDVASRSRLLQQLSLSDRVVSSVSVSGSGRPAPSTEGTKVILLVGPRKRKFLAHVAVLSRSPFFAAACSVPFLGEDTRKIVLADDEPSILALVLEWLCKGDYSPRLLTHKDGVKGLEDGDYLDGPEDVGLVYASRMDGLVLRDTMVYCAADRYGLSDLRELAVEKQALVRGVEPAIMLRSMRFAYETCEQPGKLAAFFLSALVRHRTLFRRSEALREEMELGGRMWFDLFAGMADEIDALKDDEGKVKEDRV